MDTALTHAAHAHVARSLCSAHAHVILTSTTHAAHGEPDTLGAR
jgi:hypothetical protein